MITRQIVMLSIIVLLMASAATLGQAQGNVIWSKWTDPKENAFSLEVPQGWYVEGGLIRNPENPAVDCRPYIRVTSPDGTIIITRWDYRFPNVYTGQQLSGLDFAELYLSKYPEAGCTGITITSIDNRGRVDYSCYKNGILMAGAIAAQTAPIGSSWALRDLQSYLAPAQQAKIVESLLSHMVETSYWNPQWTASNANSEQYANQQYINKANQVLNANQQYTNNANQALNGYLNQMAEQNSVTQPVLEAWRNFDTSNCWVCQGPYGEFTSCLDTPPNPYCTKES